MRQGVYTQIELERPKDLFGFMQELVLSWDANYLLDLAQTWQERSLRLGYSELRLVNGNDRLLARSARVGDGMILFNNVPPA